jgi:hypothetical protein
MKITNGVSSGLPRDLWSLAMTSEGFIYAHKPRHRERSEAIQLLFFNENNQRCFFWIAARPLVARNDE